MQPLPHLPQLVREKVYFYYNRQKWYDNIKEVHKKYNQRVRKDKNVLLWACGYDNKNSRFYNLILYLTNQGYSNNSTAINYIAKFTNPFWDNTIETKPSKYHYSSGLHHPNAYR